MRQLDDDMNNKGKINVKDTLTPDGDTTLHLNMLESVVQLQKVLEDPDSFGVTSETGTYTFVEARVSWAQRVLGWFRKG